MSPSEFDLRGALSDGEGEGIDVQALIGHASAVQRARHARRVRWASTAAVVAIAGGLGTGIALVNDNSATKSASAGSAAGTSQPLAGSAVHGSGNGAGSEVNGALNPAPLTSADRDAVAGGLASAPMYSTVGRVCAPSWPEQPSSLTALSNSALFSDHVTQVSVCGYDASRHLAHLKDGTDVFATFIGDDASAIANSLERASKVAIPVACNPTSPPIRYVVVTATYSSGRPAAPVSATTACGGVVSNGTAQRYAWMPPGVLTNLLDAKKPFTR